MYTMIKINRLTNETQTAAIGDDIHYLAALAELCTDEINIYMVINS